MATPGNILIIGSINMDMVVRTGQLPQPGETVLGHGLTITPGGKGANQAVAVARMGGQAAMIGRVGNDQFGKTVLTRLFAEQVDCCNVAVADNAATGIAMIQVDSAGENAIVVDSGANAHVNADDDIAVNDELFAKADIVVMQLELPIPTVRAALRQAKRHGCRVILDPAPVPAGGVLPAEFFAVDVLTPNIIEACQLTGRKISDSKALRHIATDLIGRGAQAVVITLDHLGAIVATADGEIERLHPYKVEWVNSTAAGDAFTGALAVAMSRDLSLTDAARFANAAGALACTKDGAIDAIPTADEVRMLMNDQPQ